MLLEIISPEKKLYSGEVDSVVLPGAEGSFGVLKNHAPIIATLKQGDIEVKDSNSKSHRFAVSGGVVEVLNNKVIVLAEN